MQIEWARFDAVKSSNQILVLTPHIETGFENGVKTADVYIDLTAVHDTVWHTSLIYKLLTVI